MKKLIIFLSLILLSVSLQGQLIKRANSFHKARITTGGGNPEQISNGVFADATDWSVVTPGWTISGGTANYNDLNDYVSLWQIGEDMITDLIANTTYILEFDVSVGTINMEIGNGNLTDQWFDYANYTVGHKSLEFTTPVGMTVGGIRFKAVTDASAGSLDNVSIKLQ